MNKDIAEIFNLDPELIDEDVIDYLTDSELSMLFRKFKDTSIVAFCRDNQIIRSNFDSWLRGVRNTSIFRDCVKDYLKSLFVRVKVGEIKIIEIEDYWKLIHDDGIKCDNVVFVDGDQLSIDPKDLKCLFKDNIEDIHFFVTLNINQPKIKFSSPLITYIACRDNLEDMTDTLIQNQVSLLKFKSPNKKIIIYTHDHFGLNLSSLFRSSVKCAPNQEILFLYLITSVSEDHLNESGLKLKREIESVKYISDISSVNYDINSLYRYFEEMGVTSWSEKKFYITPKDFKAIPDDIKEEIEIIDTMSLNKLGKFPLSNKARIFFSSYNLSSLVRRAKIYRSNQSYDISLLSKKELADISSLINIPQSKDASEIRRHLYHKAGCK